MSAAPKGTRVGDSSSPDYYKRYENERTKNVIAKLEEIAKETGRTMAQVALNWVISNPAVTAPIIGVRNLDQLSDNIGATGWFLNAKQVDDINQASRLEVTYPYDQRAEDQQKAGREL
jgi:aryl-alcohol dehydrogenase-like predicted oxidoreductase